MISAFGGALDVPCNIERASFRHRTMTKTSKPAKRGTANRPSEARRAFKVPRAAEILASHLRNQIIRGVLKEGDRLPKEQDLIQQFGVARSTFREAYVILEADGLISVSRGARKGAVVHRPSVQAAARQMTFLMQSRNVTLGSSQSQWQCFYGIPIP